jgi:hypothetical protein
MSTKFCQFLLLANGYGPRRPGTFCQVGENATLCGGSVDLIDELGRGRRLFRWNIPCKGVFQTVPTIRLGKNLFQVLHMGFHAILDSGDYLRIHLE